MMLVTSSGRQFRASGFYLLAGTDLKFYFEKGATAPTAQGRRVVFVWIGSRSNKPLTKKA